MSTCNLSPKPSRAASLPEFPTPASAFFEVLHRFYPNAVPLTEKLSAPASPQTAQTAGQPLASEGTESSESSKIPSSSAPDGVGTVTISSDPDGAEIFIDDKFLGNAPATLKLSPGSHAVRRLAPHSRSPQVQQSLPQGHSRTNLLKQTLARDRSPFAGRFPYQPILAVVFLRLPAKTSAHCPEQTPCASIRFVRRADQGILRFSFASFRFAGPRERATLSFLSQMTRRRPASEAFRTDLAS